MSKSNLIILLPLAIVALILQVSAPAIAAYMFIFTDLNGYRIAFGCLAIYMSGASISIILKRINKND